MANSKSQAHATYRAEVRAYVSSVMEKTGWNKTRVAREIDVAHTTIKRALDESHDTKYPTLMALAEHTGIPIPKSLSGAAAAMAAPAKKQPVTNLDDIMSRLLGQPAEVQLAVAEEIQRRHSK